MCAEIDIAYSPLSTVQTPRRWYDLIKFSWHSEIFENRNIRFLVPCTSRNKWKISLGIMWCTKCKLTEVTVLYMANCKCHSFIFHVLNLFLTVFVNRILLTNIYHIESLSQVFNTSEVAKLLSRLLFVATFLQHSTFYRRNSINSWSTKSWSVNCLLINTPRPFSLQSDIRRPLHNL